MRVLIFSVTFVWNISYYKKKWARYIIKNAYRYLCKVPVILVRFQLYLTFLHIFSKIIQISNSTKIRSMGTELSHANRRTYEQTDMTQLIVSFRSLSNAPKKRKQLPCKRHWLQYSIWFLYNIHESKFNF